MREPVFIQRNQESWKNFEVLLDKQHTAPPDVLAGSFAKLTNDLSFARTFYPYSRTTQYLNGLAAEAHRLIYDNQPAQRNFLSKFFTLDLPLALYQARRELLVSLAIFVFGFLIGLVSLFKDGSFARSILGDGYVAQTLSNIKNHDPMAIYKDQDPFEMFLLIGFNNVLVGLLFLVYGALLGIAVVWIVFRHGVMVGVFQFFFYEYGYLYESFQTIWIHGSIEIPDMIISGAAGLAIARGILFPGTFSRIEALKHNGRKGLIIQLGLLPFTVIAAILESYVTRFTEMPEWLSLTIISVCLGGMIWFFVIYPYRKFHGSAETAH